MDHCRYYLLEVSASSMLLSSSSIHYRKTENTKFINSTPSTTPSLSLSLSLSELLPSTTMATVLETLAVPRCSATMASPTVPPISASSVSSFSGPRSSVSVPKFRGLKISTSVSTGSVRSNPRLARRGSRIVCEAQDTAVAVPGVTDANWQSVVLESDLPVLVEFWAPWCGPCRMIHPIIDELSKEYTGKFKFFKVNTDESPSIATQYGIRSIPTVIIFKNGEKKDAVIGAVPKSTLTTSIEKLL